jgi:hypothetical protein
MKQLLLWFACGACVCLVLLCVVILGIRDNGPAQPSPSPSQPLGASTDMGYLPDYGRGYAIIINSGNGRALSRISELVRHYIIRGLTPPALPPVALVPADVQRHYRGYYQDISPRVQMTYGLESLLVIGWAVHGRLYRRAKDWQKFPTTILLHGGGDFLNHWYSFPQMVPAIHRAGFNAATLVAPYHFQRRARRIEAFDHLARTAIGQTNYM